MSSIPLVGPISADGVTLGSFQLIRMNVGNTSWQAPGMQVTEDDLDVRLRLRIDVSSEFVDKAHKMLVDGENYHQFILGSVRGCFKTEDISFVNEFTADIELWSSSPLNFGG